MVSLSRYRRFVSFTGVLLALIVLTGAAVRLTEAGLGCSDWPNCHDDQLLPGEQDVLGLIEYGNRLLSGVVGLATLGAVIGAVMLRRSRPDLLPWAVGLLAGSVAQILLGAAVVVLELDPIAVAGHFILSMVMLWNVVVLRLKAGSEPERPSPRAGRALIVHGRLTVAAISLVLLVGTLVTGTGPNSGDTRAERLGFDFTAIARVHSVLAWIFLAVALALVVRLHHAGFESLPAPNLDPRRTGRALLAATAGQGAVGYWQYLTGVPPLLVEFHILGSVVIWVLALLTHLSLFARRGSDVAADVVVDVEPVQDLLHR